MRRQRGEDSTPVPFFRQRFFRNASVLSRGCLAGRLPQHPGLCSLREREHLLEVALLSRHLVKLQGGGHGSLRQSAGAGREPQFRPLRLVARPFLLEKIHRQRHRGVSCSQILQPASPAVQVGQGSTFQVQRLEEQIFRAKFPDGRIRVDAGVSEIVDESHNRPLCEPGGFFGVTEFSLEQRQRVQIFGDPGLWIPQLLSNGHRLLEVPPSPLVVARLEFQGPEVLVDLRNLIVLLAAGSLHQLQRFLQQLPRPVEIPLNPVNDPQIQVQHGNVGMPLRQEFARDAQRFAETLLRPHVVFLSLVANPHRVVGVGHRKRNFAVRLEFDRHRPAKVGQSQIEVARFHVNERHVAEDGSRPGRSGPVSRLLEVERLAKQRQGLLMLPFGPVHVGHPVQRHDDLLSRFIRSLARKPQCLAKTGQTGIHSAHSCGHNAQVVEKSGESRGVVAGRRADCKSLAQVPFRADVVPSLQVERTERLVQGKKRRSLLAQVLSSKPQSFFQRGHRVFVLPQPALTPSQLLQSSNVMSPALRIPTLLHQSAVDLCGTRVVHFGTVRSLPVHETVRPDAQSPRQDGVHAYWCRSSCFRESHEGSAVRQGKQQQKGNDG